MTERAVEIVNELGLHARAAARLVHTANQFEARVVLRANGREAKAESIIGVLLLGAGQGTRLHVCCRGEDAHDALAAVCELIEDRFGEDA